MIKKDTPNLIEIRDVEQEFVNGEETLKVLSGVNFDLKQQSFNIIFGQSGSGKSTLLNILSGLQRPKQGQVLFDSKNIYNYTADERAYFRAEKIGIIYQTNYWVRSLSVLENVALPLFFVGYSKSKADALAMEALAKVGMEKYAARKPILLSGGEQQRVAVARAIINKPTLIIADEPTGNLDTKNGDMVTRLLRDYIDDHQGTIVMVTHNMEYLPLADHLLHIQDGVVNDLKSSSYKTMTKSLMDDMKKRIDQLAHSAQSKTGETE